jgi:anaerobic ribonucleoside-triphosphate reductase activating protein
MKIRLAAYLQSDSIVDGEGIRTVIWTQGCPHACLGCHNPETWSFTDGALVDISEVCEIIDTLEGQDGITFSGGDPMFQVEACNEIAEYCQKKGLNIWVYTGFTYEEIMNLAKKKPVYLDFLKKIDVLVDGRFIEKERDLNLLFRGSANQRLIDVPKTLKAGEVVLFDEKAYFGDTEPEGVPMYV